MCKKCTPEQITLYQIAIKLHKSLSEIDNEITFETNTILQRIVCTSRQINFEIFRDNKNKIGMITTSNKLYHISKLISLDVLSHTFVHFIKLMKIQFLKDGKT